MDVPKHDKGDCHASQYHKRCNSFPTKQRETWVESEEPHVLGNTPTRSISLTKHANSETSELQAKFWPRAIDSDEEESDSESESESESESSYDGDVEDAVVTASVFYPQAASQQAFLGELEAQFAYFKASADLLESVYREREEKYMDMRRQYFSGHTGWTEKTWEDFVALDELMAAVREELFAAQERMAQKQAFMYLFMNQEQPESGLGLWYMQSNGVKVWSLEGVAEERTRKGEMVPVLEWRGVDYNNLRADLPTLEWEDSSSSWI